MSDRIKQIRLAHKYAKPKHDNPAWMNTHHDLGIALDALEQAQGKVECSAAIEKGAVKALSTAAERIEQLEAALKNIHSLPAHDYCDTLAGFAGAVRALAYEALEIAGDRLPSDKFTKAIDALCKHEETLETACDHTEEMFTEDDRGPES